MVYRNNYALYITGPSYTVDTACSSSSYAFEQAFRCIREGICDSAIVGGCKVSLHPFVYLQAAIQGFLSPKGVTTVFDNDGKRNSVLRFNI
jgi:fatty acid synthase